MADNENNDLITLTTDIVSAHVANNAVHTGDIAKLIFAVYEALNGLGAPAPEAEPEKPKGAVSARASIKPDFLVSMIDGKPYKMLRRHLGLHGYTPESYREAFDLPRDYPMTLRTMRRRAVPWRTRSGLAANRARLPSRNPRKPRRNAVGASPRLPKRLKTDFSEIPVEHPRAFRGYAKLTFTLRRRIAPPIRPKPPMNMAHVAGSGTAAIETPAV